MSHELRTPLTAIVGFGELLRPRTTRAATQREWARPDPLRERTTSWRSSTTCSTSSRIAAGQLSLSLRAGRARRRCCTTCVELLRPLAAAARGHARAASPRRPATATCSPTAAGSAGADQPASSTRSSTTAGRRACAIAVAPERRRRRPHRRHRHRRGHLSRGAVAAVRPVRAARRRGAGIEGTASASPSRAASIEAMGGTIGVESTPGSAARSGSSSPARARRRRRGARTRSRAARRRARTRRARVLYIEDTSPTSA